MYKRFALVLILVFLTASCAIVAKPVSGTSAIGNSWVERAPMQVARSDLGVAVVNGKIYAIGGTTQSGMWPYQSGGIVGINEEYDPATDTWITETPMPTPRMDFATAVYQNNIYCIGGETNGNSSGVTEVYDPTTDTWEKRACVFLKWSKMVIIRFLSFITVPVLHSDLIPLRLTQPLNNELKPFFTNLGTAIRAFYAKHSIAEYHLK